MRIFVCILASLAVACKAGQEEQTDAGHNSSPGGGYDYAPSQNFFGGAHAGQTHDFSAHGPVSSFGGSNDYAQANIHNFAPQTFPGNQGHAAAASHEHNFPTFQQLQGHDAQARGFDLNGHGDFSSSGHGNQGDSYIQAAHDLGLKAINFGGHNAGGQGHSVDVSQEENHEDGGQNIGHEGQGGHNHQEFLLQDAGDEFGHGEQQSNHIGHDEGQNFGHGQDFGHLQDFGHSQDFGHGQDVGNDDDHTFAVGEHTDTEHPVAVPQYKHVTYPIHKIIHVNVPKPILVGVPQPYPVKVPVHKPVPVPVETEISIPVEKVVPYPIVKHVPYPVEKHVPFKVEKTVTVHVPQPYPVKIPVYKTIHHHKHH